MKSSIVLLRPYVQAVYAPIINQAIYIHIGYISNASSSLICVWPTFDQYCNRMWGIHRNPIWVLCRDGTSTAFAEYESSPSTGNLKSSPSTSTSLRYSSTSPSTAFRYSSTDSSTRAPVLESSDLPSRNIPVSFFSPFKLGSGRQEA